MKDLLNDRGVQIGALAAATALASTLIQDSRLTALQRVSATALIAAVSAGLATKLLERPSDNQMEK